MVCPRCITAVRGIFEELKIPTIAVELGEVQTEFDLPPEKKHELGEKLIVNGFELLTDYNSQIIAQIKNIIIDEIHYSSQASHFNFSTLLTQKLNKEYSTLSKLFSSVEGKTIERFVVSQKIEKVKELLFYNQLTLSEIAHQLHYSSTAHLSAQFKKETGMTPTVFKNMKEKNRKSLDSI